MRELHIHYTMIHYQKPLRQLFSLASILCFLTVSSLANTEAPASAKDIEALKQQFKELKKNKIRIKEELDKFSKSNPAHVKYTASGPQKLNLIYLQDITNLERDLVILTAGEEWIPKEIDVPNLTSRDNASIVELRQEIRHLELTRIRKAIKDGKVNHEDDEFHANLLKKEFLLLKFFQKAAKKNLDKIEKIEKEITKKNKNRFIDEDGISDLQRQRLQLLEENKDISKPIFGHGFGAGFGYDDLLPLKDAADFQRILKTEREKMMLLLRGSKTNTGQSQARSGDIDGTFIYSENLGVVLDISGSMSHFIQPLKREIEKSFERPHYREIRGCYLIEIHCSPEYGEVNLYPGSSINSFAELLIVNEVDTLYWFNDLLDEQQPATLRRLLDLLIRSGAKLNVQSVNERPSRLFKPMIHHFKKG